MITLIIFQQLRFFPFNRNALYIAVEDYYKTLLTLFFVENFVKNDIKSKEVITNWTDLKL